MKYRLLLLLSIACVLLVAETPANFVYNQSSQQCFYFIETAKLDDLVLSENDWIGAFKDGTCVGSAQWVGENTTIPLMGDDGFEYSSGYCQTGDIPQFKVWDSETDCYWDCSQTSELNSWTNNGTYLVSYLYAYSSSPMIEVSQENINLGEIVVGQSALKEIVITNSGDELLIGQLQVSGDFYISSDNASFQIESSDSIIVSIAILPEEEILYQGSLQIASDSAINSLIEIAVSASGIMAHISSDIRLMQFNNVWKDHQVAKSLTLLNDGSSELTIDGYSFSDDCYSIEDGPTTIFPGQSQELTIIFQPDDFNQHNGSLDISTNIGNYSIDLAGNGYLLDADFVTAIDSIEIGNPMQFINNSQGDILSYSWDFAQLASSDQENPEYLFPQIGSYQVVLQVSDEYFTDEISKDILVYGVAEGETSTQELEFSSNYIGVVSDTLRLAIYARRTGDLIIDELSFRNDIGAYSIPNINLPVSLAPNDSLCLDIIFTPVASGNNIDFLDMTTNAGQFSCFLEGLGLIAPAKAVTGINILPVEGNVYLEWEPVVETILDTPVTISYYKIEASTTPNGPYVWIGISPTNSFTQFGVANFSKRYFYRIIAVSED